jgi:hypothetical protein
VIVAGSGWLYRRIYGARPCPIHAAAFLVGAAAILSAGAAEAARAGLGDPPWLVASIAVVALFAGGWILFRRDAPPVIRAAQQR